MKTFFTAFLAFWLMAGVSLAQEDNVKIPYRFLWHMYQLGLTTEKTEHQLHLISEIGVSPKNFRYTPHMKTGYSACHSYPDGRLEVYWCPEFYRNNQLIEVNQPKGTLRTVSHAGMRTLYEKHLPFSVNAIKYGEIWVRMAYHYLALQTEIQRMQQQ